ncbi:hypothetical protein [Pseudomonas sp.]|uniref:gp33 family protein n=1 Tax=Pseudomonas sp. TaxID=306 RepID=UPI002589F405|nr:hypothetical protein [Pseudomonas sp.]
MTDVNAVVAHYLKLRDQKSLMEAEHKARIAEIDAQMKNADAFLLDMMNQSNQSNAGFAAGTVIVSTKTHTNLKDKGSLINFIKESGNVELLQARVSSTAVKEYMEANNNQLPPGVEITTSREISIRRK